MVGTLSCFVNSLFRLFRSVKRGSIAVTMLGTGKNSFIMRIRVTRFVLFYCCNGNLVEEWVLGYGIASVGPDDVSKEQCVSNRPQPRHRQKAWGSPSAVSVHIGRHSFYVTDSTTADFLRQIPDTVMSILPVITGNCTSSSFLGSV